MQEADYNALLKDSTCRLKTKWAIIGWKDEVSACDISFV